MLRLRDRPIFMFMWQSLEILNVLITVPFHLVFRVNEKPFARNWSTVFLVEHATNGDIKFPNKTALQKANVEDK